MNFGVLEANGRRWRFVLSAIVALYILLALCRAFTTLPWNDEAWYSSPSLSLIQHGNTGTPLLDDSGKFFHGINHRTYWVVPLQFFEQVPWFKVFGFSLLSARIHAMAWGVLTLLSWCLIVQKLTGDRAMALVTGAFIAIDYQFASQTALARMDAMAVGLASISILLYLALREKHLNWAVFASQMAVVACGLTHPTAGVPAFAVLLFLTIYCDRRNLRFRHVSLAFLPYVLGVAFWGWYISSAPELFRAQFFGNVTDIDRLGGFKNPVKAVIREAGRYVGMAGFLPGMNPLYRTKTIVILVYVAAVIGLLLDREARRNPGIRLLLWLWTVCVISMTLYDNTKEVKYAIHMIAFYDALAAVWVVRCWRRTPRVRMVAAGCGALFALTNISGLLYSSLIKDEYHRIYLPVAMFLERNAAPTDLILAGSEFGFALGFNRNIVDDNAFTYYSHKVPDFVVLSNGYRGFLVHDQVIHPEIFSYFETKLHNDYRLVYSQGEYTVFERRDKLNLSRTQPWS